MVVPIFNVLPAIATQLNGAKADIHTLKDRIVGKLKEVKDRAQVGKIFSFFKLFSALFTLAGMIISIFKNPLEFLVMIVGGILAGTLYVMYKITVYPPLNWIIFIIWFIVTKVIFLIVYTIAIGLVVVFICIILLAITFLNWITKGKLNNLLLCQNSPLAWYQIPNFHLGNKFERSLFCKSPCAAGHAPDELTGEFCDRMPRGQPSYCPQAEIMRIISNHSRSDLRYAYGEFDPTTNLWFPFMTPADKETAYKHYYLKRQTFFNKCNDAMGPYSKMTLDFCSSLDMLKKMKYKNLSAKDIARLEKVCQQGFCNSKNRYSFCGKFGTNDVEEKSVAELIKQIVYFIILCVVFMTMFYFTYQLVLSL